MASENDRLWASGEARRFAAELGFHAADQARIAVCVAELASNAAKHAGGGRVEIAELIGPVPVTLMERIVPEDRARLDQQMAASLATLAPMRRRRRC